MSQRTIVSMASHELRTLLGIIDGQAQRLIDLGERLTPRESAERAQRIRAVVGRMEEALDTALGSFDLMDQRGELYVRAEAVGIASIVREACARQRLLTPEACIIERCSADAHAAVRASRRLLYQVFENILSNAVKYSPDRAEIAVEIHSSAQRVIICVDDAGIGIPEQDLHAIFEAAYRGSNTGDVAGRGMGLHLVRALVELHEGTVTAESRPTRGTRLIVQLPRCADTT